MSRTSFPLAVAIAATLGCAAFVALLPWGDPCSLTTTPGEAGCDVLFSPLQQNLRNAGFGGICLMSGFLGGLLTRSHRLVAGASSTLVAMLLACLAVHRVYGIGWPRHPLFWTPFTILVAGAVLVSCAAAGVLGAALSRYVRPARACSGREGR
jgi:hypothetical protein